MAPSKKLKKKINLKKLLAQSHAKKNASFLHLLGNASRNRRKLLIELANNGEIYAVCECIKNTLRGNIPIEGGKKKLLSKYKKYLRLLTNGKLKLKNKRSVLKQHGGFLGMLIPAALGALKTIIGI